MKAIVTLKQGMSFVGTADSGFEVNLGAAPAVGGDDDGLRPMELMLISLAACTAMDVISILRKKRQHVTDFEVAVEAGRATEHPKVFTDIVVTYYVHGVGVDPVAVERSIELSTTKYCPAQAMLAPSVSIRHDYEIVEEGENKGALASSLREL
ncbi:MAG TPA: OsmC family protein [Candidatus Sulfomarinibacteraceae bacterium]|nr:OsmC family protein [Candidatus Sulfomarinibacteraceae bacterium]